MVTLLGKANSRASRNLWMLEELGVDYDHVATDYRTPDVKSADFLAINPGAKIPALKDGGGVAMFESLAMNLYLAQTYGKGGMWPDDAAGQAACLQWTLFAATEAEPPAVGRLVEFLFRDKPDDAVLAQHAEKSQKVLDVLEASLGDREYLCGDTFTVADINVAGVAEYLTRTGFDVSAWPKTKAWLMRCFDRAAYKTVDGIKSAEKAAAA